MDNRRNGGDGLMRGYGLMGGYGLILGFGCIGIALNASILSAATLSVAEQAADQVATSELTPVAGQVPVVSPVAQWLTRHVPSSALQEIDQRVEDELKLLQVSRYRLTEDQLVRVSQRIKTIINQNMLMFNWQQALAQQVSNGSITGLTELDQAAVFNNPLYIELEKYWRQTDWQSADFKLYQQKLKQKTPNAQRFALLQAIVVARGGLVFESDLAVAVRKQLLMAVARLANNWMIDEEKINQLMFEYQKSQLDAGMAEQVGCLMYAYRFTSTEQLQKYRLLLESPSYQAALSAWRAALGVAFFDDPSQQAESY